MAPLRERLQDHAEGLRVVLPADQAADLRVGLARSRVVDGIDGAVDGHLLGQAQRGARLDVDRARGAAFDQVGLRRLVDRHLADDFGRQQVVADAAARGAAVDALVGDEPVGAAHAVAVDQGLRERRRGAADAHAVRIGEGAVAAGVRADVDARQALHGIGHVLGRQLADVFGRDDLDDGVGAFLAAQRRRVGCTDALDLDDLDLGGRRRGGWNGRCRGIGGGSGRGLLRMGRGERSGHQQRGRRREVVQSEGHGCL